MSSKNQQEFLNKIFLGEIASVHNYGAFIKVPGGNQQGLVHKSQISSVGVDDATEVLHKADRVWCKVVKITDDGKLSLSMKVVNQGNGIDLDPNGVQINQDELKRKTKPDYGKRKAITLEAVLNTTCTKCGTKGHQARDCFQSPDGKTYELIPEDDSELPLDNTLPDSHVIKHHKKKMKKLKKNKKHKKEKRKKKNSSDLSSDEVEKKEDKKISDKKKNKKKKRKSEETESDSSSSPSQKKKKKY